MARAFEYKHLYMLPGLDGTGMLFTPLTEAFGYDCRTTTLPFEDERTLEEYIESVSERLPDHRVWLLAESFSGPIALALLARFPGRFKGAVLASTFARSPFSSFLGFNNWVAESFFGNNTLESLLLNKFCVNGEVPRNIQETVHLISEEMPAEMVKNRLRMMQQLDVTPLLSRISAPVLYLRGLKDRLVTARMREELFEGIPQICMKEVNGPHLLLQAQPRICANAILNFLALEDN